MGSTPSVPKVQRVSISGTVTKDRADWLKEQAETRLVGQSLLLEKAIDLLRDHLEPSGLEDAPVRPVGGVTSPDA